MFRSTPASHRGACHRLSGQRPSADGTQAPTRLNTELAVATAANAAPSISVDRQFDFRDADFSRVRKMIHERAGISLGAHKREMVYSLARRLRRAAGFRQLPGPAGAPARRARVGRLHQCADQPTAFFRESHHFPILADFARSATRYRSGAARPRPEEPYSIAITLAEALGRASSSTVLATDIDTNVLNRARARLSAERVAKMESRGSSASS